LGIELHVRAICTDILMNFCLALETPGIGETSTPATLRGQISGKLITNEADNSDFFRKQLNCFADREYW
jgi:hypothetical protein